VRVRACASCGTLPLTAYFVLYGQECARKSEPGNFFIHLFNCLFAHKYLTWKFAQAVLNLVKDAKVAESVLDSDFCLSFRTGVLLVDQVEACREAAALDSMVDRLLHRYSMGCLVLGWCFF